VTIDELRNKLAAVEELPALPTIVSEINTLLSNPKTTATELGMVIKRDPAITARVLKITNSAFFALPKKITSVNMAIVALGFNTVRSIVLATSVMEVFKFKDANQALNQKKFWVYSMSVAASCRVLARNAGERRTEFAFISGLLHGLGRVVFAQFLTDDFNRTIEAAREQERPLWDVQRELLGVSDSDAGGVLLEIWQLDRILADAVKHQENPLEAPEDSRMLSCFNLIASVLVRVLQLGESGDVYLPKISRSVLNYAKVSDAQWDRLLQLTMDEAERASVFLQD